MAKRRKEKALTEEQAEEIVTSYIESRIFSDQYDHKVTQSELAQQYGVSQTTICRIINSSDRIAGLNRRMKTSTMLALSMAQLAAPRVMEETIRDALKEREDAFGYLSQNARRDVLERAGVRSQNEARQEVQVTFASGHAVTPRMPERKSGE